MTDGERTERVLGALRRQVAIVVPEIDPAGVRPGASLSELGCSSMDRAEIVVLTMEELGLQVPMADLAGAQDIESLVDIIGARL